MAMTPEKVADANEAMQRMGLMHEMEMSRLRAERDAEAAAADWFGLDVSYLDRVVDACFALQHQSNSRTKRLEKALWELVDAVENMGMPWLPAVKAAKEALG